MSVEGPEFDVSGRDRASSFASSVPNSAVWNIELNPQIAGGATLRTCRSQGWTIWMALRDRLVNLGATVNQIDSSAKGIGKRTLERIKARAQFWDTPGTTEVGEGARRMLASLDRLIAAAGAEEFVADATDAQIRALTTAQRNELDRLIDAPTDEDRLRITLFCVYLAYYDFDAANGTPVTQARRNEGIGFYPAWVKMSLGPDTLPLPMAQGVAPIRAESGSSSEPSCVTFDAGTVNPATQGGGGGASVRRAEKRDSVWYAVGGLTGTALGWGLAKLMRR